MANILNYQPSSYQTILATTVVPQGMYGMLASAHYDRLLTRVVLNSLNLSSTDLAAPTTWTGPQSQTIIVQIRLGNVQTISSLIDGTVLGDSNVAEYAIPLLIPKETDLFVFWQSLLTASASKVSATLGLTT